MRVNGPRPGWSAETCRLLSGAACGGRSIDAKRTNPSDLPVRTRVGRADVTPSVQGEASLDRNESVRSDRFRILPPPRGSWSIERPLVASVASNVRLPAVSGSEQGV